MPSVVVGVTGSIAAYKAVDLVRRLMDAGIEVTVVMTRNATRFVAPLTFESITRRPVGLDLWSDPLRHIDLAGSDLVVVAPATADILSKAALGIADDLLSTLLLAARDRISFAPAMNWRMFGNPVIQDHLEALRRRGCGVVEPEEGGLACGEEGRGRLAGTEEILAHVERRIGPGTLRGRRVLVTLGPTREPIDPVRFVSNRSSGKMGAALAREAWRRGAEVIVVSGPAEVFLPRGIRRISVETASAMRDAVMEQISGVDLAFLVAAVADFAPSDPAGSKRPKEPGPMDLRLEPTPDILAELGGLARRPLLVGFAAETGPRKDRALRKLRRKGADFMVFNDVTAEGAGFGTDTNVVSIITPSGESTDLPLLPKREVAGRIMDRVLEAWSGSSSGALDGSP